MKKKIAILFCATLLLAGCGKIPKLSNGEEAVVSFTKDDASSSQMVISVNDLYDALKDQYAISTLVTMIDKKIFEVEYADKLDTAKKYADDQVASSKEQFVDDDGNYDEESFLSALSQYVGVSTIDAYWDLLYLNYFNELTTDNYVKTTITDKEIKAYYKSDIVGDISCSHILITPDVTDDMSSTEKASAEAAALAKAKEIIKELDKATDVKTTFAALAKKYSEDDNNASNGGDLGYFNKGDMQESFETAAYDLKTGEYTSTPVKTTYGYHIILKTGEKAKASLSDSKDEIVTTLATEKISADSSLKYTALDNLRKEYGFNIEDSDLKDQYKDLLDYQIKAAKESDASSEN